MFKFLVFIIIVFFNSNLKYMIGVCLDKIEDCDFKIDKFCV